MSQQQHITDDSNKVNFQEGIGVDCRIPERWSPEHVAKRLVDAFAILDRCPRVKGPRGPGNAWPSLPSEWGEFQADSGDKPLRHRLPPSCLELTQMDLALEWLRLLRQTDSGMALVTGLWAYNAARGRSIKELCQTKSWALHTFYRKRSKALNFIARYLNQHVTPVF